MKKALLLLALGLSVAACNQEPASPAPGGEGVVPIAADAGACTAADPGCACVPGTAPVTCFGEPVLDGAGLLCTEGAQYCRGGFWSACETVREFHLESLGAVIDGPVECNPCNPDCSISRDVPTTGDLTPMNSTDVIYDPGGGGVPGGIVIDGGMVSTGSLPDADGDGVPDEFDSAPTNPRVTGHEGEFFHVLEFGGPGVLDPFTFDVQVMTADIYFLVDTTGSMGGEIANLRSGLTSGNLLPGCPGGVIGAIRCTIPDAWFGVGSFDDYNYCPDSFWGPCVGRRSPEGDVPYIHRLDISSSTAAAQAAVNALTIHWGGDRPEGNSQALYAMATGNAIRDIGPRGACGGGRWGYPCFRPGTIPIVIHITDANFHNGPGGALYSSVGLGGTIPWSTVVTELNRRDIRVISIDSEGSGDNTAMNDLRGLAFATGSVNGAGVPFIDRISTNGSGLGTSIVDAVVELANFTRFDVSARAIDNPATAGVDERDFVDAIRAVSFPAGRCTGQTASTFIQCLPGTNVNFSVTFRNDVVMPTAVRQVFTFEIQVLLDGTTIQARIPVTIVVPPNVPMLPPSGTYWRDYDATVTCTIPPQRPDWGTFTWEGFTPSDTSIRFEARTADTLAGLAGATPVSVTLPPSSDMGSRDLGDLFVASGQENNKPYVRVTATLFASSDLTVSPVMTSFSLQWTCVDAE